MKKPPMFSAELRTPPQRLPRPRRRRLLPALLALAALAALPVLGGLTAPAGSPPAAFLVAAAQARDLSFCDADCKKIKIQNAAYITVQRVKVTQLPGPNNCPRMTKTHEANLEVTEEFLVDARADCPYQVTYATTSGCIGDKTGRVGLKDIANCRTLVSLTGACGMLKAKVGAARRNAQGCAGDAGSGDSTTSD